MPVKRRTAKTRAAGLSEMAWTLLTDAVARDWRPEAGTADAWEFMDLAFGEHSSLGGPTLGDLWREHGPAIVADWVRARPGTRPVCWWMFDAPDATDATATAWCLFEPPQSAEQARLLTSWGLLLPGERAPLRRRQ